MSNEIILLIGTLGGAFIGAFSALFANWINKRSQERQHLRQLIINAAIESWKHANETILARNRSSFYLVPVDDYIIHMMKFAELILDQKVNESNVEQKLNELRAFTNKIAAYRTKEVEKLKSENAV